MIAPSLVEKIAALLVDPQESVRQLSVDTLCNLHALFGKSLLVSLT
jgi:hypothetical protein